MMRDCTANRSSGASVRKFWWRCGLGGWTTARDLYLEDVKRPNKVKTYRDYLAR